MISRGVVFGDAVVDGDRQVSVGRVDADAAGARVALLNSGDVDRADERSGGIELVDHLFGGVGHVEVSLVVDGDVLDFSEGPARGPGQLVAFDVGLGGR